MSSPYTRIDVSEWKLLGTETIGQTPAVWIMDPDGDNEATARWLFKPVEIHKNGTRQGGDWAEKFVCELAKMLEIPSADIELAVRDGVEGSISRSVIPKHWDMWSGRLWLDAAPNVDYASASNTNTKRVGPASEGYTSQNIKLALADVGPPPMFEFTQRMSGFEVFAGYLLLDALVADRDRHEENWGVVGPTIAPRSYSIAPLFDNAGSLGYQLTDKHRSRVLCRPDGIMRWVEDGTAWRFQTDADAPVPTLVDLAVAAAAQLKVPPKSRWLGKLDTLTRESIEAIANRIPGMSDVSRRFAVEVIMVNAGRIRDGYNNYVS